MIRDQPRAGRGYPGGGVWWAPRSLRAGGHAGQHLVGGNHLNLAAVMRRQTLGHLRRPGGVEFGSGKGHFYFELVSDPSAAEHRVRGYQCLCAEIEDGNRRVNDVRSST